MSKTKSLVSHSKTIKYLNSRIEDVKSMYENKLYYILGTDCREHLGVIRFAFIMDLIDDIEYAYYTNIFYKYKSIAELEIKHTF